MRGGVVNVGPVSVVAGPVLVVVRVIVLRVLSPISATVGVATAETTRLSSGEFCNRATFGAGLDVRIM